MTDLSNADARMLRVLLAIFEGAEGRTFQDVATEQIEALFAGDTSMQPLNVEDELRLLGRRGLVNYANTFGGISSAGLTVEGRNLAEMFQAERNEVGPRRVRLRKDYLYWLYDELEVHDRHPTPTDFLATNPMYLGIPYTESDLEKSGAWLKQSGFIEGAGAWQYSAPLRPTLTPKGMWTVENSGSPSDPPSPQQTFNTTVHGNANVANASSNFSQAIEANTWIEVGTSILDSIDQANALLDPTGDELQALANEARGSLSGDAEPARAKRAFAAVGEFLSRSGSGALGGVLAHQISTFIASLPQ